MASDADLLVSVVSRCILDFSEQRGRSKGEAQENTVNHALHTLQGEHPQGCARSNPDFGTTTLQFFTLQRAARHLALSDLFQTYLMCVRQKKGLFR